MKRLIRAGLLAVLAIILPVAIQGQNKSIETDANLNKDTTVREGQRKIAIIVQNRVSTIWDGKVAALEDLVASRVAGKGLAVVSRDDVTRSLKNYADGNNPNGKLAALDRALEDNTSALRLAQNLGADYILVPSIVSFGSEKKNYNGNGISTLNITYRLRVTYKIVEGDAGGSVRGGAFVAEKTIRQTEGLQTQDSDVINELLDDAAAQLAEAIAQNAKSLPVEVAKAALVNLKVACAMTDPRQQPVLISALGITEDNHVIVANQPVPLQILDVTVELDGVALGSAPGAFQARPGLHKIRLSREGFATWERTINIYDGQILRVAMQMSNEGYARWADTTAFLATLDANRKLTDAEVKRIEGIAEFFKNSHYRVDTQENIHVTYRSLF